MAETGELAAPATGEPDISMHGKAEAQVEPAKTSVEVSPEPQSIQPVAASAKLSPSKKKNTGKTLSILGSNLASGSDAGGGQHPCSPTSGKNSRAIAQRYAYEVKELDRNRKLGHLPMQQQTDIKPTGLDMARDMRAELHDLTSASGGAHLVAKGVGWDAIMGNDSFQKRLHFLQDYARTGNFKEQYGEDSMYEGEFMHGMRHGKGRYEFRKEIYDGEWKWDHRHGWGSLTCSDGTTMKGDFQNGRPHGFVSVVNQKGIMVYEGEFKDGKRHGLGRQVFDSGDSYDGGWQNGRLHDRGRYCFKNGDRLDGMWQEGVYHGVGMFHYADGSISRREYNNGKLMLVQDCQRSANKLGKEFGKVFTRDGMQKHTHDQDFPKRAALAGSGDIGP